MQRVNILIEVDSKQDADKIIRVFDYTDLTADYISGNSAILDGGDVLVNACFPASWSISKIEKTIENVLSAKGCQWESIAAE